MPKDKINEQKKSEEVYRTIFENLPFIAFTLDRDGKILEANKYAEGVFGLKIEDVRGKKFSELGILGKKDLLKAFMEFRKNLGGKVTEKTVYNVRFKDGEEMLLELIGIPLKEGGKVTKVLDVGSDITEQRTAEEKIRESERKFGIIFDSINDMIVCVDRRGNITDVNKGVERVLGYQREEVIGKNFTKLGVLRLKDMSKILKLFAHSITGGKEPMNIFELEVKRKNGNMIPLEASTKAIKENGKIIGTVNILRDITARKRTEEALMESEKKLHDILMSSADFIWEVDKNGKYTFTMGNVKKILGYEPKELIDKTPFDLMEKEEAERVGKIFKEILSAKKPIVDLENWNTTKDGRKVCLLTNGVPIIDENGNLTGYRGVDKDITDRKIKEGELKKRTEESERFSKLSVGRELKMVELKKRINELEILLRKHGLGEEKMNERGNEKGETE